MRGQCRGAARREERLDVVKQPDCCLQHISVKLLLRFVKSVPASHRTGLSVMAVAVLRSDSQCFSELLL